MAPDSREQGECLVGWKARRRFGGDVPPKGTDLPVAEKKCPQHKDHLSMSKGFLRSTRQQAGLMLSCRSDARIERVQAMACMAAAIRSSLDPSAVACDEVAWPVNVERTRSTRASRGYERAQSGGLARQGRPAGEMGQWRGSRKGRRRAGVGRQPAYSMACRRDGPWSLLEGLGVDCTLARMGSAMPAC